MKWLLIVLLVVVLSPIAGYSGTFMDDFSDGDLDGWDIFGFPRKLARDDVVWIEDEHLVLDTRIKEKELPGIAIKVVSLELQTGDEENWDSYTLTLRVRFKLVQREGDISSFNVSVRTQWYNDGKVAFQSMSIFPGMQGVDINTSSPDDPKGQARNRQKLQLVDPGRRIKLNRWIPIKIVAEKDFFEFHFGDNLLVQYEDETSVPGTVGFGLGNGLLVHLDDVVIAGPGIPNIGVPHNVSPVAHLAATWGEIKGSPQR